MNTLKELLCLMYNSGYKTGHNETVEGEYVDVYLVDYLHYHEEDVIQILFENGMEHLIK